MLLLFVCECQSRETKKHVAFLGMVFYKYLYTWEPYELTMWVLFPTSLRDLLDELLEVLQRHVTVPSKVVSLRPFLFHLLA